jgi:hypothetical protein
MSACAVAGCAVAEWSSIRLAAGRGEIAETTVNRNVLRLKEAWTKICEALSDCHTSFYHLHLIPDGCNKALLCARQQATLLLNDPASAVYDKNVAETLSIPMPFCGWES